MQITARELAAMVGGTVEGDPEVIVRHPGKIEDCKSDELSFLGHPKYESFAYTTRAAVLLVDRRFVPRQPITATLIRVDKVYAAFTTFLHYYQQQLEQPPQPGISPLAHVDPTATVADSASVGRYAVVEAGVEIGAGVIVGDQVYLGPGVRVAAHTTLKPGVKVYHGCTIGQHCLLHANAVVGADGFGFAPDASGTYHKIPQVGNVVIEDYVEIGANTTIDRATMGSTVIRRGVKLDNLIQIGHNVEIGCNTVIAAQTGVAGSTRIGANCRIGGQVGFVGHLTIADGTQIQAQSGIGANIDEPNRSFFGTPAINYNDYVRSYAVFKKLPELYRKLGRLLE